MMNSLGSYIILATGLDTNLTTQVHMLIIVCAMYQLRRAEWQSLVSVITRGSLFLLEIHFS